MLYAFLFIMRSVDLIYRSMNMHTIKLRLRALSQFIASVGKMIQPVPTL